MERFGAVYAKPVCGMAVGHTARCHAWIVTDGTGHILSQPSGERVTPSGYSPANLQSAYKITGAGSSANTVAIVDSGGYSNAETDLGVYRSQFGLPACTTANGCFKKLNQNGVQGSYPANDTGWSQETALDLDMASAMCPNCHILLVEGDRDVRESRDVGEHGGRRSIRMRSPTPMAAAKRAQSTYEGSYNHTGIAVTASSGDDGYAAGPQFPRRPRRM